MLVYFCLSAAMKCVGLWAEFKGLEVSGLTILPYFVGIKTKFSVGSRAVFTSVLLIAGGKLF